MPLPLEIDYVVTESSPIKPGTLTRIQECIRDGRHGAIKRPVPIAAPMGALGATVEDSGCVFWNVAETFSFELPLIVGERIIALRCYIVTKSAGGSLGFSLEKRDRTTQVTSDIVLDSIAAVGEKVLTPPAPGALVEPNTSYYAHFSGVAGGENVRLSWLEVEVTKPT